MTQSAQRLLAEFEQLAEPERVEVLNELLRRVALNPHELPADSDLVAVADELFATLDEREQQGEAAKPR
jgi:hypothetical protein